MGRLTGTGERALFYSHDSLGLGHLKRTLLIAEGLSHRFPRLSSLIVTGSAMAHAFRLPPRVDYVKLPSVVKVAREDYASRSLDLSFEEVRELRQEILYQTAARYAPDFFFVDTVPCGLRGEALKTLGHIRRNFPETRIYLVLRDILDDPALLAPAWEELGAFQVLQDHYDRVFVCGHSWLYDPVEEYGFPPSLHSKVRFCGYLQRDFNEGIRRHVRKELVTGGQKLVVVTPGGGADGEPLARSFLRSLAYLPQEVDLSAVLLLGPEMSSSLAGEVSSEVDADPRIRVLKFSADSVAYMAAADLVLSMGGYNTLNEVLYLGKPAIVTPRVHPRREQLIRARRLAELGLIEMIHPRDLTPQLLAERIRSALCLPRPTPFVPVRFEAVDAVARELSRVLEQDRQLRKPFSREVSASG